MSTYALIREDVVARCVAEISSLELGQFQARIEEIKRSNQANALYWKWVSIIAKDLGHDKEDLHDAFKRNFIGEYSYKDPFGRVIVRAKESKKLKKKEFSEYMNKVWAFAAGENIKLPSPDFFGFE